MGKVSSHVYGSFVTDTVRELFWERERPLETVMEILLGCMSGTSQPDVERLRYARDVLLGRCKLAGFTGDGTYGLDYDEYTLVFEKIAALKAENKRFREYIEDNGDDPEEILEEERDDPDADLLDAFLAANRHDDNYGWLSPAGKFTPVDFALHMKWAVDYLKEHGFLEELAASDAQDAKDFLILVKGWVLLHNPYQGIAIATSSPERALTKAQREFLYDYYVKRHDMDLAKAYLEGV